MDSLTDKDSFHEQPTSHLLLDTIPRFNFVNILLAIEGSHMASQHQDFNVKRVAIERRRLGRVARSQHISTQVHQKVVPTDRRANPLHFPLHFLEDAVGIADR